MAAESAALGGDGAHVPPQRPVSLSPLRGDRRGSHRVRGIASGASPNVSGASVLEASASPPFPPSCLLLPALDCDPWRARPPSALTRILRSLLACASVELKLRTRGRAQTQIAECVAGRKLSPAAWTVFTDGAPSEVVIGNCTQLSEDVLVSGLQSSCTFRCAAVHGPAPFLETGVRG